MTRCLAVCAILGLYRRACGKSRWRMRRAKTGRWKTTRASSYGSCQPKNPLAMARGEWSA